MIQFHFRNFKLRQKAKYPKAIQVNLEPSLDFTCQSRDEIMDAFGDWMRVVSMKREELFIEEWLKEQLDSGGRREVHCFNEIRHDFPLFLRADPRRGNPSRITKYFMVLTKLYPFKTTFLLSNQETKKLWR